jgi:hypothetical protein
MQFGKVALAVRQQADLAEPIARRALMTVAMNARAMKPAPRLRG